MQKSNTRNTLKVHPNLKVTGHSDAEVQVEQGRAKSESRMNAAMKEVFDVYGISFNDMGKLVNCYTENNESDKWIHGNAIYKQSNNYKKREKLLERTVSKEEADVNAAKLIESIEKVEKNKLKKLKQKEKKRSEKKKVEEVNKTKEKANITMSETNLETISIDSSVTNENSKENHDESVDKDDDEDINFLNDIPAFVNTVIKRNKKYDTMVMNVKKATVGKCDKNSTEGNDASGITSLKEDISADNILDVHNANFTVVKRAKRVKQSMRDALRTSEDYGVKAIQLALSNKFLEAIDYLSEAIALYPIDIRHYANRSYCYLRLGQYELALNDTQFIIKNTDDINELARATCRAGQAFRGMQNYTDAEKCLEESVQLIPASSVQRELLRTRIMHLTHMGFREKDILEAFQRCSMTLQDTITVLTEQTLVKTAEDNSVEDNNCDNDDDIFYSDDEESPSNTRLLTNIITKWSMSHDKSSKNVHTRSLAPE